MPKSDGPSSISKKAAGAPLTKSVSERNIAGRGAGGRNSHNSKVEEKRNAVDGRKGNKNVDNRVSSPEKNKPSKKREEEKKKVKRPAKPLFKACLNSMGIGEDEVVLTDPRAIEASQALNLQSWHLKKLKRQFNKIDQDGSGSIDRHEFLAAVNEESSPFTDKLFDLIDQDGSGTIEFEEYVCVMATYCMFTKDEIMTFCFECFDTDGSGAIDEKEFMALCKAINNSAPNFPKNFTKALEEFDTNQDGMIDYQEFLEVERRFPIVMFPAFRLQDTMQRGSLGEKAWLKIIENYNLEKKRDEYRRTHGGALPPEPAMRMFMKSIFPCFYKQEKTFIAVGSELQVKLKSKR